MCWLWRVGGGVQLTSLGAINRSWVVVKKLVNLALFLQFLTSVFLKIRFENFFFFKDVLCFARFWKAWGPKNRPWADKGIVKGGRALLREVCRGVREGTGSKWGMCECWSVVVAGGGPLYCCIKLGKYFASLFWSYLHTGGFWINYNPVCLLIWNWPHVIRVVYIHTLSSFSFSGILCKVIIQTLLSSRFQSAPQAL